MRYMGHWICIGLDESDITAVCQSWSGEDRGGAP